ncbi:MAG: dTDP-4-dehydrorhamnose reductase [Candidatus Omnitrophica bacterium]|nr:dTDP-4-dehydrorhamnose reductase [Candidatus Omnitrophota bacterium]
MKILITGAGGMLGSDLASALQADFTLVGVDCREVPHLTIPCRRVDLSQKTETLDLVRAENPDVIFHAAAMTDVDGCESRRDEAFRNNLENTKYVVRAANELGSLLIFFSTDYVFDGTKEGEYVEDDPPNPLNVYAETKYLAEQFIQRHVDRYLIFRTSWLYGYYGKSFPRTILERALSVKRLTVVADQVGRPTYTQDIAAAFRELLSHQYQTLMANNRQIFHLAGEGIVSWANFARGILSLAQYDQVQVVDITSDQLDRPARRPHNSVLSTAKLRDKFGVHLRSWQKAMPEFLKQVRAPRDEASSVHDKN